MNKRRFCDRSRGAATAQLLLLLLLFMLPPPPSALASEESANASTEAAGQRARFMQDFCGTSPEAIAQYKEKLAKSSPRRATSIPAGKAAGGSASGTRCSCARCN